MHNFKVVNLYYKNDDGSEVRIKDIARSCPKHLFKLGYAPLEDRFVKTIKDIFNTDILDDLFKIHKSNTNTRVGYKRIKKELWRMYFYLEKLNYEGLRYVKLEDLVTKTIPTLPDDFESIVNNLNQLQTVRRESWFETKIVNNFKVGTRFNNKVRAIIQGWLSIEAKDPYLYEQQCLEIMIETCDYVLNSENPKNYFIRLEDI